jgi:hypothetical protein
LNRRPANWGQLRQLWPEQKRAWPASPWRTCWWPWLRLSWAAWSGRDRSIRAEKGEIAQVTVEDVLKLRGRTAYAYESSSDGRTHVEAEWKC